MRNYFFNSVGYLALGILGLSLAIPPGYASPVFPAAGFALAVVAQLGMRQLPAIWVGSVLLNVGVALSHGNLSATGLLVAFGIATGSTLQAWLGAFLIHRNIGASGLRLESLREIVKFLVLGGVVACVVSASFGVSMLTLNGIVSPEGFAYAWWNWYCGDLLGVTTFSALVLGLLQKEDAYWRLRLRNMVIPVSALLVLAAGLFLTSSRWEQLRQNQDIVSHGERVANKLQTHLAQIHETLGILSHFLEPQANASFEEFLHVTGHPLSEHEEISGFSFNMLVADAQREQFERDMARQLNRPGFRITERVDGKLVPAGKREKYVVVSMISPLKGNEAALGFDILSEGKRRDAIERAIASQELSATAPLKLVQDKQEHFGILLLHPSFARSGWLDKSHPQESIVGFAVAVVKLEQLFHSLVAKDLPDGIVAEVSDPFAPDAASRVLYRFPSNSLGTTDYIAPWEGKVQFGDRLLTLTVHASDRYSTLNRPWLSWAIGAVAMLFVSVFQILMLVITGRTSQIQRQVDEQTIELSKRNQALLTSESKLNRVIDVMPEVVLVIDAQGIIQNVNERVQAVLGYESSELTGKSIDVLVPAATRGHHAALRERYTAHPEIRPMGLGRELFALHKDGRNIPVEIALAPMSTAAPLLIIVTVIDISQRLIKEQALRDSEQRFRLMSESIHDYSIVFLDKAGTVSTWNKGVQRIKGYRGDEVIGKSIAMFYSPEDLALGLPDYLLAQAREHGSVENQGWRLRKDGSRFFADVILTAIRNESGELIGYAKITRDVSERKRLEDNLKQYQENLESLVQSRTADLEVAKEAAEAASRAKTTFLSMASHELRTPMNGIMGTIALARRRTQDEKLLDYLDKADRSAKHLLTIINDVLDISRIEADKLTLARMPFSVGEIAAHIQDNLSDLASSKGVPLIVEGVEATGGQHYLGDPTRITQVLMNLVGNALKFTHQGEVRVMVELLAEQENERLRFSVADTGIGICKDDLSRIFSPFEQADNGMTRKYGGTGLGLALCRRLVEAMGGVIGVNSVEGHGSTFWFEIPVPEKVRMTDISSGAVEEDLMRAVRDRHAGSSVLVAEDEPINQEIITSFLEDAGIVVTSANDGREAVDAAKSKAFDLILMDMNMPNMGGIEATTKVRLIPGYQHIPIIALTANAFAEDKAICLQAGMNEHLGKPVIPGEFYATILRWLDWKATLE